MGGCGSKSAKGTVSGENQESEQEGSQPNSDDQGQGQTQAQEERQKEEERKKEEEKRLKEEEEKQKKAKEEEEERKRLEDEKRKKEEEEKKQEAEDDSSTPPPPGLDMPYIEAAILEHNMVRAMHGVPPLKYSEALSKYAQKWAEHMSNTGQFAHSDCDMHGTRVGENLAMGFEVSGAQLPAKNAVKMWYDEMKDYEKYFGQEPDMEDFMKFGHFTQVVWKDTREVGIGVVTKDGKTAVVGTYYPAGNISGSFKDNVFCSV